MHGVLRVSVVHGNCPPLTSKPVCSELGLGIDTSSHTVSSRKHGVKAYGLEQSRGGHYVIPIDGDAAPSWTSIGSGFDMPDHVEIQVFDAPRGSAIREGEATSQPLSGLRPVHGEPPEAGSQAGGLRAVPDGMGKRGTGSGRGPSRDVRRRGAGERGGHGHFAEPVEDGEEASAQSAHPEVFIAEPSGSRSEAAASQADLSQEDSSRRARIGIHGISASTPADEHGAAPGDDDADAGAHAGADPGQGQGDSSGPRPKQWAREGAGVSEGQEDAAEGEDCGIDRGRGTVSYALPLFSDDPTMNLMISLKSQTLTFKWKMLLLLLRIKAAVETEKKKWRRNPRWIMWMQGNHIAALWGHLGAARQLCYSPKVVWLGE